MRLKILLTFLVLLSVSLGMRAASSISTTDGVCTITLDNPSDLGSLIYSSTDLAATKVVISCNSTTSFTSEDVAKINQFTSALTLDMSGCKSAVSVSDLNMPNLEYLRLPNSMTSAEDVAEMAKMKNGGKNSNLKMVGAYDPDNSEYDNPTNKWAKVAMHSFESNNVTTFINTMNIPTIGTVGSDGFIEPHEIRMSGEYGVNDLVNGTTPNFGYNTSAEWDFTGAHFADCTIPAISADYYSYNNPFCEGDKVAPFTTTDQNPNVTSTNAFYYFSYYDVNAIDVKLPDNNMTHLPTKCFYELAKTNSRGYIAKYGQTAYDSNKLNVSGVECVPIDKLTIPDCYTDLDQECAVSARIRHLVVGEGVKRVHGGAFKMCLCLEDLDFAPGISDCYLGDNAFNQCESMKHIQLSEGIVSLGANCFDNSQHLESIRLPETLKYIGNNCFHKCYALSTITIPENVEKIGMAAFYLCGLTDVYLTTKDPAKVPVIYTHGRNFSGGDDGTFYKAHYNGINSCPNQNEVHQEFNQMTWDEAAAWYYSHCNLIATLHYPEELTDKLKADLCDLYDFRCEVTSEGGYGLPSQHVVILKVILMQMVMRFIHQMAGPSSL